MNNEYLFNWANDLRKIIYYQIQNLLISMKKNQSDSSRTAFNRKNQHTSPTHFPKKQFEFIYREKDHLPSSEAFQSIIFMKSKKCQQKSNHLSHKNNSKSKKPHVEQLKQVISQIEKQLNQQQNRKNKRIQHTARPQILKNTSNSIGSGKKIITDNLKSKSSHRLVKAQKIDIANSENVKSYKNLLSPTKLKAQKSSENQTKSSKFANSTQQTFRKTNKNNDKKKSKKENRDSSENFTEPDEYILVGDEFVSINFKEAEAIEQKLLSSRAYIELKSGNLPQTKGKYSVQSPIVQDQLAQRVFQQYLMSDDKSSEPTPLNNSKYEPEVLMENNLVVVQKYIVSKIKIIQRWWRKILLKNKEKNVSLQQHHSLQEAQKTEKSIFQQPKKSDENQQNFERNNKMIGTEQFGSSSPIKLVDQFFGSITNRQTEVVNSRQNAVKIQLQTHKSILQKLLISKKITAEVYIQRKEMIEAKYYNELQQIQQLKRIIQKNVTRVAEIQKKTQQDLQSIENTDVVVNNNLLDKIFGVQFAECFEQQAQHENNLVQVPQLSNQLIINRQKSRGCHYESQDLGKISLYKKQNHEAQDYDEDFQEYDEQNENNAEFKQFCNQNVAMGQAISPNFKDLFNEFKLRQEVRADIDRRAAIQMGVLVQDIPQQIKRQIVGIDTSLNSIHRFLLAFFKFYIFYNKYDFLRLINMPYGYNIEKRLKSLQGYQLQDSFEQDQDGVIYGLDAIIPEQMFEQFYEKIYALGEGQQSSAKLANFQFEKIHNKVLFDCFNESLNYFRPYFIINGPPYPWNYSEKALTFYFIGQENIQQVFQKTQFKVLKWASNLCGLIVNKYSNPCPVLADQKSAQQLIQQYKQANHPLLNETREDRLNKNQKVQIIDTQNEWNNFIEQQTFNFLKIGDQIFNQMIEEMAIDLQQQLTQATTYQTAQNNKQMRTGVQFFQNMSQNSSLSEFQIF